MMLAIVVQIEMTRTVYGRSVIIIGQKPPAARLCIAVVVIGAL
jgi:ribose/xylose/arabinose/galactoside ABC-type transport system permease subunit